ncbi:hypothetical protein SAMN05216593_107122 [Pseudomonas asturiensis]|uniref:Uncharacterized protein n=1 Tax=Pseudomonas asturiensis TaxID=1190415 RepID=A0A1M7NX70_9PSED|nr:hypothetical protein SAMN05216593_107122 [Pseudomonas asturiensis]
MVFVGGGLPAMRFVRRTFGDRYDAIASKLPPTVRGVL